MNIESAQRIISTLADGKNPVTNEILASSDVVIHPDVLRAMLFVRDYLLSSKSQPRNRGAKWTEADIDLLKLLHSEGRSFVEIAGQLQRTKGAIISRLVQLGIIDDPFYRFR